MKNRNSPAGIHQDMNQFCIEQYAKRKCQQTARREASAGCFHDREAKGFFVTFFTRLWLTEESNGGSRRRSLSTGFKALYGRVFL